MGKVTKIRKQTSSPSPTPWPGGLFKVHQASPRADSAPPSGVDWYCVELTIELCVTPAGHSTDLAIHQGLSRSWETHRLDVFCEREHMVRPPLASLFFMGHSYPATSPSTQGQHTLSLQDRTFIFQFIHYFLKSFSFIPSHPRELGLTFASRRTRGQVTCPKFHRYNGTIRIGT